MIGVNFFGDLNGNGSLSELARTTLLTLQRRGIPLTYTEILYPYELYRNEALTDTPYQSLPTGTLYPINLVCYNLHLFGTLSPNRLQALMQGKYTIACWVWEMPDVPAIWQTEFSRVNEIWVPSAFVQQAFQKVTANPVVTVPYAVEAPVSPQVSRADFGLPADRYIFLYTFSAASGDGRKNPWDIIEAFKRAFGRADQKAAPLLVMKTQHSKEYPEVMTALAEKMAEVGGLIIPETYSRQQMNDLMAVSDAFVSLHRAEGFGLGMAEAMYVGKPVIATAYSGNMDFMTETNSYPVPYTLRQVVPADHQYRPELLDYYTVEMRWAEPDVDRAAHWMQHLYTYPEEGQAKGSLAAQHIRQHCSPEVVGQLMYERIAAQSSLS